jgi:hypothetical protein
MRSRERTRSGRETTRAIRAVLWCGQGIKTEPAFHRIGGSLTQAQSRVSTGEHEHCVPNMPARGAEIKCDTLATAPASVRSNDVLFHSRMNNNRDFQKEMLIYGLVLF